MQEIQSQIEQGKIPTNKKPNQGYDYNLACLDCKGEWSYKAKPLNFCPSCLSKKIKIYDAQGFLQQISAQHFYKRGSFWIGAVMTIACLIGMIYQTMRWKKAKKMGKKYSWWTDKIV
ncbi:MAG: Hydrogenase maturation factor HypA [Mycoplasmataceae bacterium]|nr:MAG: Hydrogenase maturation factor HypA [Mycoplasmataceae bacterium]